MPDKRHEHYTPGEKNDDILSLYILTACLIVKTLLRKLHFEGSMMTMSDTIRSSVPIITNLCQCACSCFSNKVANASLFTSEGNILPNIVHGEWKKRHSWLGRCPIDTITEE